MIRRFKTAAKYLSFFFTALFVIDFIQINIQLFKMQFDFSSIGIAEYFKKWQDNADTLALSFTVISLYYIFEQIELAHIQNYYPLFEKWKTKHRYELDKLKKYSIIYNTVDHHLFKMYYNLISTDKDFRINDKKEMLFVLGPILTRKNVQEFDRYMILHNESTQLNITSYSLLSDFIQKTFIPASDYTNFNTDLQEFYTSLSTT